jgi:SagB-type dehydrogenase family enzyme
MGFTVTVPTDRLLRAAPQPRLFELYHVNSKLTSHHSAGATEPGAPTAVEQFMMTRGFRQYQNARSVALPTGERDWHPLQEVMRERRSSRDLSRAIELVDLGSILDESLGCTAVAEDTVSGLVHGLRAWPSAGGLYPLDTYVIARDVGGLDRGLYHYNAIQSSLEELASRDPDAMLADAYFDQAFAKTASAAILFIACFERATAKYGDRGYRLVMLDAGHACQNVLLSAHQKGIGAVPIAGFCDDSLASDLHLDGVAEAVVHTVLVGRARHEP